MVPVEHTGGGDDNVPPNQDQLTVRLNALRAEGVPKPVTGPVVSDDLVPILNLFLAKSDFTNKMTLHDKYPRPDNIQQLSIPELPKDANRIIDQKAVKTMTGLRMIKSVPLLCFVSWGGRSTL